MRLLKIVCLTIILSSCCSRLYYEESGAAYDTFVMKVLKQYNHDKWKRPTDTLFYIPVVMNLWKDRKYQSLSVDEKRAQLFVLLSRKKPYLSYIRALSPKTGALYTNPRGDLDYWEGKSGPISFYRDNIDSCHSNYIKKMSVLREYILENKPTLLFQIGDVHLEVFQNGDSANIFWSVKDSRLYALRYEDNGMLTEYEATYFITNVADDSLFSVELRLR